MARGKRDAGDKPLRKMADGSPCWCVSEQEDLNSWQHSPRCMARRALSGGYDFTDLPHNGPVRTASQRHKKSVFLRHYSENGLITRAADAAGVERSTVWRWAEQDPVFKEQMDYAAEQSIEVMEAEARRRGIVGYDKPVFQGGEMVGHVREYSDTLLIFMLKGAKPNRYRDNVRAEISGPGGGPIQTAGVPIVDGLSDHEKRLLRKTIDEAIKAAHPDVPVEASPLAGEPSDGS